MIKPGDEVYNLDGEKVIVTKVEEDPWSISSPLKIWYKRPRKGWLDTKYCFSSWVEIMAATCYYKLIEKHEDK